MKSPFLLGAALCFWGWQTGYIVAGIIMGVVLESARYVKARWDLADDDFSRIWTFCSLLFLAVLVYAFTDNQGPADFLSLFQNPSLQAQRSAGTASARTAAILIRWLPMIFFLFVAAQYFSSREGVPLETISLILRRRWKKARKLGQPVVSRTVNVGYPYLVMVLFAASIHPENHTYFWGLGALVTWAMWLVRSPRFRAATWIGTLAAALVLGYFGQRGINQLQRLLENYNPTWLARSVGGRADPSKSRTGLGHIGRLKHSAEIVIRLESKSPGGPPAYLREAVYHSYRDKNWYAPGGRSDFESVAYPPGETNGTTFLLVPDKTNSSMLNIACYLPGSKALLPLPEGSGRLENLPAYVLTKNSIGAVLAEGPGLVIFDARYGPGPTIDSPPTTNDLTVPSLEEPALRKVIGELHLSQTNRSEALRAVHRFLQGNFSYSTWQGPDWGMGAEETPLARFLLQNRRGHCEYFATATALLLRELKIPARYAVGYAVHEGAGQKFVVRSRDAHAWCLVWNSNKQTWDDFDTTPASWIKEEGGRAGFLLFLSDAWSRLVFEFSKLRWGQTHLRQYILLALIPILGLLLYQIISRSRRRRNQPSTLGGVLPVWPGLDSEFYRLERKLVERGFAHEPGEPLSSWLARAAADPELADLRGPLKELVRLHYRYRFDPQGLTPKDREELRRQAADCLASLTLKPAMAN